MRPLHEIIIHCSATRPEWAKVKGVSWKVEEIRRWHTARGWSDIGYHYVVDRDGKVAAGRPVERTGAHTLGHNTGTIGVCLIGGHGSTATDEPTEHFTNVQLIALRDLIEKLKKDYPSIRTVSGHNEYAAKACPGFRVDHWYHVQPIADHVPAHKPVPWWVTLLKGLFK